MTDVPEQKLIHNLDPLDGYEQYNHRNWDGYDAKPITPETLRYARLLLNVMPDTFGPPDIAPSGDGSIGLEWVLNDGPLHKLFLDIGPGKEWCAYWKRRNAEFGRLHGLRFSSFPIVAGVTSFLYPIVVTSFLFPIVAGVTSFLGRAAAEPESAEFGRSSGAGFDSNTRQTLLRLFADLSG